MNIKWKIPEFYNHLLDLKLSLHHCLTDMLPFPGFFALEIKNNVLKKSQSITLIIIKST